MTPCPIPRRGKMIQGYIARIKQQLDADKPKKKLCERATVPGNPNETYSSRSA